jgi:aminopeptidase N
MRTFERTPKMSTYLLAFFISDFEGIEQTENGRTFRAFAQPSQINNTALSMSTARDSLKLFESTFNVTYGSNKLDQVAVPAMKYDAMENNFIIFYQKDSMLYESGVTRAMLKETVARVVTHEVSL